MKAKAKAKTKTKGLIRALTVFALFSVLIAGLAHAQGMRALMERKAWYVDNEGKIGEMLYWRIVLGDFDIKLKRNFPGEGQLTIDAGMGFQFLSSGYIEGNGASARGRVQSLPGMRIRIDGKAEEIKLDAIDYIHDYGAKVVLKDGRRGDFLIGAEGGELLEPKRFQLTEFRMSTGQFGEPELGVVRERDMMAIAALAFSREAATKAAQEPR